MPQIATWSEMPMAVRQHLIERMRDRKIGLEDLNRGQPGNAIGASRQRIIPNQILTIRETQTAEVNTI